jgi:hypothetical protein
MDVEPRGWVSPEPYKCDPCRKSGIQVGSLRFHGQEVPRCPNHRDPSNPTDPSKDPEMTPVHREGE